MIKCDFSRSYIDDEKYNDNTFKIIYVGSTLSSSDTNDLIEYLKNKKFCINVISKSGNTLETNIMYNKFKEVLKENVMI